MKGKTDAKGDAQLDSEVEAHLCQLAMMENYAAHLMYVKFSNEEATELEERSFQLALRESREDEEARRYKPSACLPIARLLESRHTPILGGLSSLAKQEGTMAFRLDITKA